MPIFIGSNTQSFTFDFYTKVANSTVECPMDVYEQNVDLVNLPNPTTGWVKNTSQNDLDKLKIADGVALSKSTIETSKAKAIMIMLDITAICRDVYGNSNDAMKSSFKNTSKIDIYAIGSGANSGSISYLCVLKIWNATLNKWDDLGSNSNNIIAKQTFNIVSSDYITTDNKIYLMIASGYASDGTISSTVQLDYVKFRLDFSRVSDVVSPINTDMSAYFTIFLKELAFAYAYDEFVDSCTILKLYKDNNNYYQLYYDKSSCKFIFIKSVNGVITSLSSDTQNFKPFQAINILLENSSNGMKMYIKPNNGNTYTYTNADNTYFLGSVQLYLHNSDNSQQPNAFYGGVYYFADYNPTSDDAIAIVSGQKERFESAQLLYASDFSDASKWTLANNANISNKTLLLPQWNSSAYQDVAVFPNNKYKLDMVKNGYQGIAEVKEYYNNFYIRSSILGAGLSEFTTTPYTNKTRILFGR